MSWLRNIAIGLLAFVAIESHGRADDVVAYKGATVETVSKAGTLANGTVLIRDGRIEAVGTDVDLPTDARVIDVSGLTIMPALVDAYHPVTISGLSSGTSSRTVVFNGRTFTIPGSRSTSAPSYAKLSDVLDPLSLDDDFQRLSRSGVGFTNIVTRGFGQSVHARTTPGQLDDAIVEKDGHLFLSVTNSTAVLDVLRKGLKGSSGSSSRSQSGSSTASAGSLTSLWSAVRDGRSSIILNANNAAAITYVLQILKDYPKTKVVLVASGADVYLTIDQLKESSASLLIKAGLEIAPRSSQRINVAQMLNEAGLTFGFSSSLDSSLTLMPDTPLFPVSLLVKTGLPKEAALKALTLSPASMLGLEKTLGSIEKGKQASLLVLDGDPLDAMTSVRQLLVEGKSIYENQ